VGGNTRLNSAVLNSASIEGGLFHYSLDTSLLVAGDYLIDFYASPVLGGDVEGQRYLGTVSNVAGGNANFDDTLSGITLSAGEHVTLLVTDVGGNTSEFSSSVVANEHVNESPIAINNGMTAREGETTTLTSAMLGEADPDDSSTGLTYTITASPSSGFLARASSPLASINTFTQADVDNAEIIYVHDGSESATDSFGFSLADGGEDGAVADTGTFTIDIDPVNDAPTFSNHGGTEAYTEDTSPVVLDSDVSVFDPELSQADDFGGSTITLQRNGAANADDIFSPTGDLTFNGGILELTDSPIGTYANADGILQITFDPLTTNDQVNEVMRSIAYANSNDAPPASVQIDWVFDDGNTGAQGDNGALEATGSTTVSITAVNDAPTVDNAADLVFTVDEDNLDPAGDLISDILASGGGDTIVDFDNANEGIAVTSVDLTNGTWQYSLDDGGSWNDFVAVSETNATLLDAGNRIRFIPNADFNGAAGDIVFRAWDQSVGADGDTGVDVTTTGGSTAFSVLAEKAEIVVNAINDDPVIGFGSGDISYEENDLPTVIDATITASDIDQLDFDGGTLNVALTGNGTANDILSINDQGMGVGQVGVTTGPNEVFYEGVLIGAWSGSGAPLSVTFNGAADAEAVQAVMQNVTYANQSDDPSDSTRTVAFQLTDGDGGTSNSIQKDILFTAVNDAPTITNLIGDTLDYVEGDGGVVIEQGADIVTSDPDSPNYRDGELRVAISSGGLATEDVISIRSVGNGAGEISVAPGGRVRFEGTTIGTFSGGTAGVPFTIQFNSAADNDSIAAAIESIVYENINTSNPLSGSRSVDFTLSDGDGATSPAHTVLINVGTINDAPIVTIDGLGATYTENGIGTQLDSGLTIIDPDGIENFSGGNLTASVTDNGTTADQLLVLHEGNGPGQVEVAGATILIDSVVIGTISGGNGSGDPLVVSFSANADTSHVEQVGQRVAYANTSDAPSELQRTVSLEVTDSGGATSIAATQTVDVVAVNDTPDVTTPTSLTATEQIEVSIAGAGLAVADADSGLNTVTATLSVAEGVLSATQGDSGVSISGSGSSTLTLSGTIDQINDLLARSTSGDVTYLNSSDTPSAGVTLTLEVNDNGNQGIDPGLTGNNAEQFPTM
jgi:hypothetical protein